MCQDESDELAPSAQSPERGRATTLRTMQGHDADTDRPAALAPSARVMCVYVGKASLGNLSTASTLVRGASEKMAGLRGGLCWRSALVSDRSDTRTASETGLAVCSLSRM